MEKTKSFIGYTVIVKRYDGKPMFLVAHEQTEFMFPGTKAVDEQSGLSTIIDEIKETLNIDFEKLELSELTNAVIGEEHIPLFVFTYDCSDCTPQSILLNETNLEWQTSDNFKKTLQQYEIKGVPFF